jgi:16S rRNA (uracil1498-N3)-methyltransferase
VSTRHRFFVPPEEVDGDHFPIPPGIRHQVERVLRLRDGDRLALLTGDGVELLCSLADGMCTVEERRAAGGEPAHRLSVAQALLKGDGLEEVVRQGTELGVGAFRLVVTDRCVARVLSPRRLERLRAIARESAEQAERGRVPVVHEPVPLTDVLAPGTVLLAERSDARRLGDLDPPGLIVVGPEGGFSPGELEMATRAGAVLAGLGPRILRSRTVAAAVAAAVLSRTGDFA